MKVNHIPIKFFTETTVGQIIESDSDSALELITIEANEGLSGVGFSNVDNRGNG